LLHALRGCRLDSSLPGMSDWSRGLYWLSSAGEKCQPYRCCSWTWTGTPARRAYRRWARGQLYQRTLRFALALRRAWRWTRARRCRSRTPAPSRAPTESATRTCSSPLTPPPSCPSISSLSSHSAAAVAVCVACFQQIPPKLDVFLLVTLFFFGNDYVHTLPRG
jgi:hypothetical protein